MNVLSLFTRSTEEPGKFHVYWRTGLVVKGCVVVKIKTGIAEDADIAAELSAARYLLEDQNVCGHNKAGKGLELRVTFGAIKKLVREESSKSYLSPYANFLRTRFVGAAIDVENRNQDWANEECHRDTVELIVDRPKVTTITVGGFGEVELTSHAIQRYINRFGINPENAWRRLVSWGPKAIRFEVPPKSWQRAIKYPRQASFAVSHNHEILLVIVPPRIGHQLPCMVTIYSAKDPQIQPALVNALSKQDANPLASNLVAKNVAKGSLPAPREML